MALEISGIDFAEHALFRVNGRAHRYVIGDRQRIERFRISNLLKLVVLQRPGPEEFRKW